LTVSFGINWIDPSCLFFCGHSQGFVSVCKVLFSKHFWPSWFRTTKFPNSQVEPSVGFVPIDIETFGQISFNSVSNLCREEVTCANSFDAAVLH